VSTRHRHWCRIFALGDHGPCDCGSIEQRQQEAIEILVAIIRAVVPLAAAAQRQRLRLLAQVTDLLGDYRYTLSYEEQRRFSGWYARVVQSLDTP
jgi:hypothetical protein